MKTVKITIEYIKDPDMWQDFLFNITNDENERKRLSDEYFEYGEYASLDLEIDDQMNVVCGRILPIK